MLKRSKIEGLRKKRIREYQQSLNLKTKPPGTRQVTSIGQRVPLMELYFPILSIKNVFKEDIYLFTKSTSITFECDRSETK